MVYIVRRSSRMAIKAETTEGTPVEPTAGTDFIPLQDDYSISPNREAIENVELTGSIGQAPTILGAESPEVSFSGYLKHSGVEGQEPTYGPILESIWGSKNVYVASEATIASATTTTLTLGGGEGANYARGYGVLVKDSTNGYSIRTVVSVSTDTLTLNAPLGVAPLAGVKVGKPITYIPADSGHPSISCWQYEGNEGAVQLVSGVKFTGWNLQADAGQPINGAFTGQGIGYYFDPITITASSKYIDFSDSTPTTYAASIVEKTYKDPEQLATALQTAMNDTASGDTFTVTYSNSTGKFTIASDATPFSILWNTGANTANTIGAKLGFSVAADDTGSQSYVADNAQDYSSPYEPVFDAVDPLVAKSHQLMFRKSDDTSPVVCVEANSVNMNPANTATNIQSICAESGIAGTVMTGRTVTMQFTAPLNKYDAEAAALYRRNDDVIFQYAFGEKADGTNWDAGKSGCFSTLSAKISALSITDVDGISYLDITLQAYVSNGLGETYLNFL